MEASLSTVLILVIIILAAQVSVPEILTAVLVLVIVALAYEQASILKIVDYAIGQEVPAYPWLLVVSEVNRSESPWLSEGYEFLVIELSVTNQSDRSHTLSSLSQFELKDAENRMYQISMSDTSTRGKLPEGIFAPGETIEGRVAYEIPKGMTGFQFVFKPNPLGQRKYFVRFD